MGMALILDRLPANLACSAPFCTERLLTSYSRFVSVLGILKVFVSITASATNRNATTP